MARKIECPMCGHYNSRSQSFCPVCGTRVIKSTPSQEIDDSVDRAPISRSTKRRNSVLVMASIVYLISLILPFISMPVYDAGPIPCNMLMLLTTLTAQSDLLRTILGMVTLVTVVMTVLFVVSSINNVNRYKKGRETIFGRNVFYLITIPALYIVILFLLKVIMEVRIFAYINIGFIVVVLTGLVSIIGLAVVSIDKNRVSTKNVVKALLTVICFAVIIVCMFQPVFSVSITKGDSTSGFDFSLEDLRRFYDADFLEDHYKNIEENGALQVIRDAEDRLFRAHADDKGKAIATMMMTTLSAVFPMLFLVSVVAMILSASAIFSALLTKLCTLNEKKLYLIISKLVLLASSASLIFSMSMMLSAITEVRYMIPTLSTLTFSVMAYPVVAIVAAIVMIFLGIKEKNYDYVVINK